MFASLADGHQRLGPPPDTPTLSSMPLSLRRPAALALLALAMLAALLHPARAHADDALQRRVLSELRTYTDWLNANGVKGYVGEVGWPDNARGDAAQWNALAQRWYQAADAAGLWVSAWATGEWWGTTYPLAAYEDRLAPAGIETANTQAGVIEAHPTVNGTYRGINVAGGEFGTPVDQPTSAFSNANRGTYDREYHYDSAATFAYLAAHGVRLVRIPIRWERLQPALGQSLDQVELQRIKDVVARAGAAGLQVVLDLHNYGAYYLYDGRQGVRRALGSAQLPDSAFADVWRRLSVHFKDNPSVIAYGLMNEPVGLSPTATLSAAQVWERASQAAVDAIRGTGDQTYVRVAGYFWSGVTSFAQQHPRAWIRDPLGYVRYEAHHYFDRDHSGHYTHTYAEEVADAAAHGY
jgi:Cellulase (glycosyl hydrolase family 5)